MNDLLDYIGKTPIINLKSIGEGRIYAKLERNNPSGSIKDRPAYEMIREAIESGKLSKGMKIVEPTSGNTGIGLAMIGKVLGYEVVLIMPESMSIERRKMIAAYGAKIELTPASEGMQGSVALAKKLAATGEYFMPDQFNNLANAIAHEKTTGPEIYNEVDHIGGFIAGFGTGGTVVGAGRYLKSKDPKIQIWGLEPKESPLLTEGKAGSHKIQGIGANFVPGILDRDILDKVITISGDESIEMAKRLGMEEGLAVGITSGANVLGALEMAKQVEGNIVTVLPDSAERYLSTALFEDYEN